MYVGERRKGITFTFWLSTRNNTGPKYSGGKKKASRFLQHFTQGGKSRILGRGRGKLLPP